MRLSQPSFFGENMDGHKVDLVNMHYTDTPIPYMEQNGERVYFRTPNSIFVNSSCLFIEYYDIIRSPYFMFLLMMANNPESFEKMFDVARISGFGPDALGEWYLERNHQNPFVDLVKPEILERMSVKDLDNFMNDMLEKQDFLAQSPLLNFSKVITEIPEEVTKNIIIWYPVDNEAVENDVRDTFGERVRFVTGDLVDFIDEVPKDATYVFSDITNVDLLYEKKKLYLNSILIPSDYRYNYTDNGELKIDVEEYQKEVLFKLDFFASSIIRE